MIKNIFNKIFTFKNIMFCLCIGIAIISTFFSCEVRAYTNEDVTDFVNQLLVNENVNSTTRSYVSTFKDRLNTLFSYMETNNINLESYKGFSVYVANSGGYYTYNISFIPTNTNISYSNSNYYATNCFWIYIDKWRLRK